MSLDIDEEIKKGSQRAGVVAMDIITITVLSMQAVVGSVAIGLEGEPPYHYNRAVTCCEDVRDGGKPGYPSQIHAYYGCCQTNTEQHSALSWSSCLTPQPAWQLLVVS